MAVDYGLRFFQSDDGGPFGPMPGAGGGERDSEEPKPLGVPEGYTAPRPRGAISPFDPTYGRAAHGTRAPSGRSFVDVGPRYHVGDEWRPATRPPESITAMQRGLIIAGYLSPTESFRRGAWDGPTRTAYKQLLEDANAAGMTDDEMLAERARTIQVGGETGRYIDPEPQFRPPPLELQTTNKADLKRAFRSAVIDKLGVGKSEEEIAAMAQAYIDKEIEAQRQAYETVVERERAEFEGRPDPFAGEEIRQPTIPSPETFLEQQLIEEDPVGFQTGQFIEEIVPNFMSILGGWV